MSDAMTDRLAVLPGRIRARLVEQDGHWIWTGQVNNKGYGLVWAGYLADPDRRKGKRAAHVVVYELLVGPVPAGLELDHECPFTLCCNPACLEPVTHAENMRRGRPGWNWRAKTHCPQGHPYDEENTYRPPGSGDRLCRECRRVRNRERQGAAA